MASGIKDKVAIIGMGCSYFGERWSSGPDDLMVEAFDEALADAGIARDRIDAAWLGVFFDEQKHGQVFSATVDGACDCRNVPTTRVENLCATGTEALRGAVYAVAAGACDFALAMGVEKLKDTGFQRAFRNGPREPSKTCICRRAPHRARSHSWPVPTPSATNTRWTN